MIKNIEEAISYIHGLPKMHKSADFNNLISVLEGLNNPHKDFESIHITGTNGKGSVSHLVNNLLIESNLKVGMFTSPYIIKFNERIQINNQFISDEKLIELTNEIIAVISEYQKVDAEFTLVEFEFVTVLGFLYFSQEKVDIAIIEVGIGGYHDKTNVIDSIISVMNNVGLDHQKIIGPTLADIATEKSGVIKKNNRVILGEIETSLKNIFYKKAEQETAQIIELEKDFLIKNVKKTETGFNFDFNNKFISVQDINLPVLADYQISNVAVAIETYYQYCDIKKIVFNGDVVKKIVAKFNMPARMQVIKRNPLIIIDGAHNQPAAKALISSLQQDFPNKKINFLVAVMKDKDFSEIFKIFDSIAENIKLTTFLENRSLKLEDIKANDISYQYINDWKKYLMNYKSSEEILVVTGSLHFVSEVLRVFA